MKPSTRDAYQLFHEGALALAEVERAGFRVDVELLKQTTAQVDEDIAALTEEQKHDEVWRVWKRRFGDRASMGSRKQLATVLFDELGHESNKRTEKGNVKVDEEVLGEIDLPFVKRFTRIEKLKKLKGTYLSGINSELTEEGYIHPSFNLHLVRTFRSCVAKGTLVEVVRDVSKYPKGKPIEDIVPGDFVYCYDDNLNLVLRRVKWAGKTGHREVIRVHWSARGKKGHLDVTPEHRVRLVTGVYVEAENLVGIHRPEWKSKNSPRVQALALGRCDSCLYITGNPDAVFDHRFVYEQLVGPLSNGQVVHHKDRNHLNNQVDNLESMSLSEHSLLHCKDTFTKEVQRKGVEGMIRAHREGHVVMPSGKDNAGWIHTTKFGFLRQCVVAKGGPTKMPYEYGTTQMRCNIYGINLFRVRDRFDSKGWYISLGRLKRAFRSGKIKDVVNTFHCNYKKAERLLAERGLTFVYERECRNPWGRNGKPNNHAITRVERLGMVVDVYDIEVEDCHNFIANEICVHNSSDSPNIQNQIRRDEEFAGLLRRCFIPRDGHVLVEIDYSALEFRIASCFWADAAMVKYASDPTLDIHRDMAEELYLLPHGQVPKMARFYAKNQFVFPELYGSDYIACTRNLWNVIGTAGLTTADGVPLGEHLRGEGITVLGKLDRKRPPLNGSFEKHVLAVERRFNKRFPQWADRREQWWSRYQRQGWFRTMTGFVCKGVYSRNELMNYPIQGPAFHCLLWSLTQMVKWIRREKLRSRVVAQIHDSVIGDVHRDELDAFIQQAKQVMTVDVRKHWGWIIVPLDIEVEVGERNWFEKKTVKV